MELNIPKITIPFEGGQNCYHLHLGELSEKNAEFVRRLFAEHLEHISDAGTLQGMMTQLSANHIPSGLYVVKKAVANDEAVAGQV